EGYNARLDAIQAGILRIKLSHLSDWNRLRRVIAATYHELFAGVEGLILPFEPSWARSNYHLYVVRVGDREKFRNWLAAFHIGTGIHYPIPLHLQNAYKALAYRKGDFLVAERVASEIVSLPMFPQLKRATQSYVAEKVWEYFRANESRLLPKVPDAIK